MSVTGAYHSANTTEYRNVVYYGAQVGEAWVQGWDQQVTAKCAVSIPAEIAACMAAISNAIAICHF